MKCYRAIDKIDNKLSLFVLEDEKIAVATDTGQLDDWTTGVGFNMSRWSTDKYEPERMINPELVWQV